MSEEKPNIFLVNPYLPRFNCGFMAINWGWVPCQMSTPQPRLSRFWSLRFYPRCRLCGNGLCERHVKLVSWWRNGMKWVFFLCGLNMRFTMVYPTSPWYMMIYDNMCLTYLYIIHIILWNWECRSKLQLRKKITLNAWWIWPHQWLVSPASKACHHGQRCGGHPEIDPPLP